MSPEPRSTVAWIAVVLLAGSLACDRAVAQTVDKTTLVSVCDVARNPQLYEGKALVIYGRVAKRGNERSIGEDGCKTLGIRFDSAGAPLPPQNFGLNAEEVRRRFAEISAKTTIHDFPFGSGSYEHLGLAYGRLETSPAAALLCRGEALIFLWNGR